MEDFIDVGNILGKSWVSLWPFPLHGRALKASRYILTLKLYLGVFWDSGQLEQLIFLLCMKHCLPYKLGFLGFKLQKYFGVFKDPKIRVTLVFLKIQF